MERIFGQAHVAQSQPIVIPSSSHECNEQLAAQNKFQVLYFKVDFFKLNINKIRKNMGMEEN